MSRWLERKGLTPAAVDEALIDRMLVALRRTGKAQARFTPRSFRVVVEFLRSRGVVAPSRGASLSLVDALLGDYREYLVVERALAASTQVNYMKHAAWFVSEWCGADGDAIAALSAADVSGFVLAATP